MMPFRWPIDDVIMIFANSNTYTSWTSLCSSYKVVMQHDYWKQILHTSYSIGAILQFVFYFWSAPNISSWHVLQYLLTSDFFRKFHEFLHFLMVSQCQTQFFKAQIVEYKLFTLYEYEALQLFLLNPHQTEKHLVFWDPYF